MENLFMRMAPVFSLPDQVGNIHTLGEYAGKWLVIYFYPADDTPGCTTEACEFRDGFSELSKFGATVIGISPDSAQSHSRFVGKYRLNFTLLADESRSVMEAYGAWGKKKFFGKETVGVTRKTFIVNPAGKIVKEYPKVAPKGHFLAVLNDIALLSKGNKDD